MILVDTSIWIDHLRQNDAQLAALLIADRVYTHPFVIGELACGNLGNRQEVLDLLRGLPQLAAVSDDSVLRFIEERRTMGRGIGYVDAHLLAATTTHPEVRIWTRDKRLKAMAEGLLLAWSAESH